MKKVGKQMEEMLQNPQEAEVQMTTAHGVCDVRLKGTAFERYDGKQPCLDHESVPGSGIVGADGILQIYQKIRGSWIDLQHNR